MENWLVIGWTGHSGGEGDKPELAEDIFSLEEYPIINSLVYSASMELLKGGKQEFSHPVSLEFNTAYQQIFKYINEELEPVTLIPAIDVPESDLEYVNNSNIPSFDSVKKALKKFIKDYKEELQIVFNND